MILIAYKYKPDNQSAINYMKERSAHDTPFPLGFLMQTLEDIPGLTVNGCDIYDRQKDAMAETISSVKMNRTHADWPGNEKIQMTDRLKCGEIEKSGKGP
jgi:hypothetical protein